LTTSKSGWPSPEAELATDHLLDGLGRRSRRGGVIMLASQGVKAVAQIATLVALARLLPPQAFGLLAMVAAISALLDLVKEFGLSAATIQRSDITHAQVSALFWINASVGLLFAAALVLAAPLLASFYGQPELEAVTRWLALAFVLSGLGVQHWALLRRQMRFAAIAGIEIVTDLVALAASLGMALAGFGYWALVAQRLIAPGLLLVASWAVCRWRPSRPALADGVRELLGFGASVTASGLAVAFARSIDQILIGWLWGAVSLGLYERTGKLLSLPLNTINAPVYAAAMPALSRLVEQPDRYRTMFHQVMQKLALLTMPAFVLVAVTSDWIVQALFGPSWANAAPLVFFFALSATYVPVLMGSALLYMTQARTGEMLRATLLDSAVCLASILAGLHFGAVGVAASVACIGLCVRLPLGFWLATRRGSVSLRALYGALVVPAIAAIATGAAAGSLRLFVLREPGMTVGNVALVGTGGIVAAVIVVLASSETRREMRDLAYAGLRLLRRQPAHRPHRTSVFPS
jgi:PST family polysaccharide transporter